MSIRPRVQLASLTFGLALLAWTAAPARAGLVFQAPTFTAASGTSGSFDVVVFDNDPIGTAPFNVANADLDLSVGGTGISFTNVTINTATPYIFVSPGSTGGNLYTTLTASNFHTTDNEFAGSGFRTIGPGDSFGLAHVSYTIDSGAVAGSRALTINGSSDLSDIDFSSFGLTFTNGSITVQGAAGPAVPEPSTIVLVVTGALALCLARGCRRHTPVARCH